MYYTKDYKLQVPLRKSGAYVNLFHLFSEEKIISLMRRFDYSDENFAIMAGDESYLKRNNPQLLNSSEIHSIRKDNRNLLEYFQDLIAGWLFEDCVECIIDTDSKLQIQKNGADKERKILIRGVKYTSDFKITYENNTKPLELIMDYDSFFKKNGYFHLRLNKYDSLKRENALLLSIDIKNNTFYLLDFSQELIHKKEQVKPWGNKEAETIFVSKIPIYPLSELKNQLKKQLKGN